MDEQIARLLRAIPGVGDFLASGQGSALAAEFGEGVVKWELRHLLQRVRAGIQEGSVQKEISPALLAASLRAALMRVAVPAGRTAINATGILLHTGLGRAPLCQDAVEALQAAAGYTPLQTSLESGDRSLREERVQRLLQELVGCGAATVVNNNAAATMLVLNTVAAGKEVVISRGQLIEIGGSFRMTEVMAQSGAVLREVGTTNRTHLRDYESAISERTGALLHVHTSNYRVRGFAGTPSIEELVVLGRKHRVPVIDDLGSGALVPLHEWGISDEPLVKDSMGADLACFSADKLICGPQAGIICGQRGLIEKIRRNPYARMFRVCKLTLAALEATLLQFVNGRFRERLPFYRMLSRPAASLEAEALAQGLAGVPGVTARVDEDVSYVGSGSIPDEGIPTRVVRVRHERVAADLLAKRLRLGVPPVFGRLADRHLVLDLRTLRDGEIEKVVEAVRTAVMEEAQEWV